MKKRVLISSCLIGLDCRYDGGNNYIGEEKMAELCEKYELVPFCAEIYGGLTTPRVPSERVGERVMSKTGCDVTSEFAKGAELALRLCRELGCELAILKENSPSCGSGTIYDGSFTGKLREGFGVTAELLAKNGIQVIGETKI